MDNDERMLLDNYQKPTVARANTAPWGLLFLPIIFGLTGGGFAAMIADFKFQSPWARYIVLGVLSTIVEYFVVKAWITHLIR